MKTLLVTGVTGFVGYNLVNSFLDYRIIGIFRSDDFDGLGEIHPNISFFTWHEFVKSKEHVDVVINLAGKAHDLKKVSDESEYVEANVNFTKKVFEWFSKSEARLFIQISSIKAVLDHAEEIVTEETPVSPSTIYGLTKLEADIFLEEASGQLPDKSVIILRPCMIHGPGNKGNLNLLYKAVKKRIPYPLGAYNNIRSFTAVDNLLVTFRCIIEKAQPGFEKYLVCDENSLSTTELVRIIGEESNVRPFILKIPKPVINSMAKVGDVLNLPFNTERLTKLVESFEVDSSAIRAKYSITYPLNAEEGIRKTISSFNHG